MRTTDDAYEKTDGLHPIPSILDLPSLNDMDASKRTAPAAHTPSPPRTPEEDSAPEDMSSSLLSGTATTARRSPSPARYALRNRAPGGGPAPSVAIREVHDSFGRRKPRQTGTSPARHQSSSQAKGKTSAKLPSGSQVADQGHAGANDDAIRKDADVLTKVFVVSPSALPLSLVLSRP